jgi:hypothetical protein
VEVYAVELEVALIVEVIVAIESEIVVVAFSVEARKALREEARMEVNVAEVTKEFWAEEKELGNGLVQVLVRVETLAVVQV